MDESRKRRTLPSNPNYPRVWATQAMNNYGNRSAKLRRINTKNAASMNISNMTPEMQCFEYEYQIIQNKIEKIRNSEDRDIANARMIELKDLGCIGRRVSDSNCLQNEINDLEQKYPTTVPYYDIPQADRDRMVLLNMLGFIKTGGKHHRKQCTCRYRKQRKHRKYHTRRH
jgi:hypothetical protein